MSSLCPMCIILHKSSMYDIPNKGRERERERERFLPTIQLQQPATSIGGSIQHFSPKLLGGAFPNILRGSQRDWIKMLAASVRRRSNRRWRFKVCLVQLKDCKNKFVKKRPTAWGCLATKIVQEIISRWLKSSFTTLPGVWLRRIHPPSSAILLWPNSAKHQRYCKVLFAWDLIMAKYDWFCCGSKRNRQHGNSKAEDSGRSGGITSYLQEWHISSTWTNWLQWRHVDLRGSKCGRIYRLLSRSLSFRRDRGLRTWWFRVPLGRDDLRRHFRWAVSKASVGHQNHWLLVVLQDYTTIPQIYIYIPGESKP